MPVDDLLQLRQPRVGDPGRHDSKVAADDLRIQACDAEFDQPVTLGGAEEALRERRDLVRLGARDRLELKHVPTAGLARRNASANCWRDPVMVSARVAASSRPKGPFRFLAPPFALVLPFVLVLVQRNVELRGLQHAVDGLWPGERDPGHFKLAFAVALELGGEVD